MTGATTTKEITSTRLEAFSDGVIAIIITIMVLALKVPQDMMPGDFISLWPIFVSYALSFFYVAIYWMNHHHLIGYLRKVDNVILWANMLLLFCISFIPFATGYMGESHMTPFSTAIYSGVLLGSACAFYVLLTAVGREFKGDAKLEKFRTAALRKNVCAIVVYAAAIPLGYVHPAIAVILTFAVGMMYFLPNAWVEPA